MFKVDQVDHVEVFVRDRYEAAAWYERVLGLTVVPQFESWAEHPRGPLMISSDSGSTKLALFTGDPQAGRPTAGWHLVAFRVDADGFATFLDRIDGLGLVDHNGRNVTRDLVVDHGQAYSIYFNDPYGHRLEITTYDYVRAGAAMNAEEE
jgi:catechol 2,3-dioxygenase-like lactoylglutathione lyase family enzyme